MKIAERLVINHADRIRNMARHIGAACGVDASGIDDLAQAGVIAAIQRARKYVCCADLFSDFWPYAFRYIRFAVIAEALRITLRTNSRTFAKRLLTKGISVRTADTDYLSVMVETHDPSDYPRFDEIIDAIAPGLPADQRSILSSIYVDGHSVRQIGERCGVTKTAIRKRRDRILERLRLNAQHRGLTYASLA